MVQIDAFQSLGVFAVLVRALADMHLLSGGCTLF